MNEALEAGTWASDVRVRNAALHIVEALTGRRAGPYDVDCVLGCLIADRMRLVPFGSPETDRNEGS